MSYQYSKQVNWEANLNMLSVKITNYERNGIVLHKHNELVVTKQC